MYKNACAKSFFSHDKLSEEFSAGMQRKSKLPQGRKFEFIGIFRLILISFFPKLSCFPCNVMCCSG